MPKIDLPVELYVIIPTVFAFFSYIIYRRLKSAIVWGLENVPEFATQDECCRKEMLKKYTRHSMYMSIVLGALPTILVAIIII